jgi:hypothetical protein
VELRQKDIRASTIDRLAAVYGVSSVEFLAEKLPATKVAVRPASTPHKPRRVIGRKPAL